MRILNSFKYAIQGIIQCSKFEKNFRLQLVIGAMTFVLGGFLSISVSEWIALLFCSALVLGFEMINTAIEKLSNVMTQSIHPVIKHVKDIAAGAVCLVSIVSFIIACLIFLPKIHSIIKNFIT